MTAERCVWVGPADCSGVVGRVRDVLDRFPDVKQFVVVRQDLLALINLGNHPYDSEKNGVLVERETLQRVVNAAHPGRAK